MSESPQPDERPRPQYGEYAPPGWQPPVPPQPVAPAAAELPSGPGGPLNGYPAPWPAAAGQPIAPAAKPRTADRIVSIVLLAFGAVTVLQSADFLNLGPQMQAVFERMGLNGFTPPSVAVPVGWALLAFTVVLYALVLWWSVVRLRARRLTWWVPFVGGVVAGIAQMIGVMVVMFSSPGIDELLRQFSQR
ncbi:MAG TPA: DUF6264 family protein [Candidatus Lumbricidophila sp.]|nr:DUF6264 family protein [Candidatus Lumbricidophila sp.]